MEQLTPQILENTHFVSDTHFGHANIITYCKRPFKSVEEMDEVLIKNWNSQVKPGDVVYHLGDIAFGEKRKRLKDLVNRLNGTIMLLKGNHDHSVDESLEETPEGFKWCKWMHVLSYKVSKKLTYSITLCHFPVLHWLNKEKAAIHLYGHVHGNPTGLRNALDVGVDSTKQFRPLSLKEVLDIVKPEKNIIGRHATNLHTTNINASEGFTGGR